MDIGDRDVATGVRTRDPFIHPGTLDSMEELATKLLTGNMQGTCADSTSTTELYDTWEIAFNPYHNRMGIDFPETEALIQTRIRPDAPRAVWNLVYETLTHARR
jgi:hypothetical protein